MANQQDLTGLRITLERKACCCANAIMARVEDDAGAYELRCAECGSRGERLPERAVDFLRSTVRVFGTPPAPIFLSGAIRKATAMNRSELFPSKYIKAADLGGKPLTVTIKSAAVEALNNPNGGGQQDKLLLSFVNQPKKLVCNVTNFNSIADLHGDETDNWPGKRIELYPTKASVGGKSFDAVRVRAPVGDALNDKINF